MILADALGMQIFEAGSAIIDENVSGRADWTRACGGGPPGILSELVWALGAPFGAGAAELGAPRPFHPARESFPAFIPTHEGSSGTNFSASLEVDS